jgi:hypothetical protein
MPARGDQGICKAFIANYSLSPSFGSEGEAKKAKRGKWPFLPFLPRFAFLLPSVGPFRPHPPTRATEVFSNQIARGRRRRLR